ncbi:hypothetical protein F4780DRAFT_115463 [Xylariomycetidae sp. FL0641]|nr:hypothetical protein F4780DRAFT_115463 [Xylariomycetidae sp. FL0641]
MAPPPAPPPPATPTPHRFVVPKRSQQQQQRQRTNSPRPFLHSPAAAAAFSSSSSQPQPQFQATPRFFAAASTPRPSPAAAPASTARFRRSRPEPHAVDVDVDVLVDSSPPVAASVREDGGNAEEGEPAAKRRRLSVSSASGGLVSDADDDDGCEVEDEGTLEEGEGYHSDDDLAERDEEAMVMDLETREDDDAHTEDILDQRDDEIASDSAAEEEEADDEDQQQQPPLPTPRAPQPTFQRAPRFKPPADAADGGPGRSDPLPDAFSPHRGRGGAAKYVPGGMAATLRDWLVDVEAGAGHATGGPNGGAGIWGTDRKDEWTARVRVEEVTGAAGMRLVGGRRVVGSGGGSDKTEEIGVGPAVRVLLAGSGRLAPLARRIQVVPGSVVGVARPTWEMELPGLGRWVVACDWAVLLR